MMKKFGKKLSKKDIKELQNQLPELECKKDKEFHCVCDNCGFGWYEFNVLDKEGDLISTVYCPNCFSGEIYTYDENDDNF